MNDEIQRGVERRGVRDGVVSVLVQELARTCRAAGSFRRQPSIESFGFSRRPGLKIDRE
jgi:hypothetical protein